MIKRILFSLLFLFSSSTKADQRVEVQGLIYKVNKDKLPVLIELTKERSLYLSFSQLLNYSVSLHLFAIEAFKKSNQLITSLSESLNQDDEICFCLNEFLDLCIKNDRDCDKTGSKYRSDLFICSVLLGMRAVEILLYVNSLLVEKLYFTTFNSPKPEQVPLCALFKKMLDGFDLFKKETIDYDPEFKRRYNLDCFVNTKLDYFLPGFSITAVDPENAEKIGCSVFLPRLGQAHFSQELCDQLKIRFYSQTLFNCETLINDLKQLPEKDLLPMMFENGDLFSILRLASFSRVQFLINQADLFLKSLDREQLCETEDCSRNLLIQEEASCFDKISNSEVAIKINEHQMKSYNQEILNLVLLQKEQIEELKEQKKKARNQLLDLKTRDEKHKHLNEKYQKEIQQIQTQGEADLKLAKEKNKQDLAQEMLKHQQSLQKLQDENAAKKQRNLLIKKELEQVQKQGERDLKFAKEKNQQALAEYQQSLKNLEEKKAIDQKEIDRKKEQAIQKEALAEKKRRENALLAEQKVFEQELAKMKKEHLKKLQEQQSNFEAELAAAEESFLKRLQEAERRAADLESSKKQVLHDFTSFTSPGNEGEYRLF